MVMTWLERGNINSLLEGNPEEEALEIFYVEAPRKYHLHYARHSQHQPHLLQKETGIQKIQIYSIKLSYDTILNIFSRLTTLH